MTRYMCYAILVGAICAPAVAQTVPVTTLQVVNARASELTPLQGPNARDADRCSFQGCAEPDYAKRVAAIQIDRVWPWTTPPKQPGFAKTETVATCPLESDGSVRCVIPSGITYQLRGIDAAGAVVATDNTMHSAVQGERVTCRGCHFGHGAETLQGLPSIAEAWAGTIAGKK